MLFFGEALLETVHVTTIPITEIAVYNIASQILCEQVRFFSLTMSALNGKGAVLVVKNYLRYNTLFACDDIRLLCCVKLCIHNNLLVWFGKIWTIDTIEKSCAGIMKRINL